MLNTRLFILLLLGFGLCAHFAHAYEPYDRAYLSNQINQAKESLSLNQAKWSLLRKEQVRQYAEIDVEQITKLIAHAKLTVTQAELSAESAILNHQSAREQILRIQQQRDFIREKRLVSRNTKTDYNAILDDLEKQLINLNELEQILSDNVQLSKKILYADENYYHALKDIAQAKEALRKDRIREINISHLKAMQRQWDVKAIDHKRHLLANKSDNNQLTFFAHQMAEMIVLQAEEKKQMLAIRIDLTKAEPEIASLLERAQAIQSGAWQQVYEQTQHLLHFIVKNRQLVTSKMILLQRYQHVAAESKKNHMFNETQFRQQIKLLDDIFNDYRMLDREMLEIESQLRSVQMQLDKRSALLTTRQQLPNTLKEWKTLGLVLLDLPQMTLSKFVVEYQELIAAVHRAPWYKQLLAVFLIANSIGFCVAMSLILSRSLHVDISQSSSFTPYAIRFIAILFARHPTKMIIACLQLMNTSVWLVYGEFLHVFFMLSSIWLIFAGILTASRMLLLENFYDQEGRDARLFFALRWALVVGGVLTTAVLFAHELSLPANVSNFVDRSYMLVLLAVSYPLLRNWEVMPSLFAPYITNNAYVINALKILSFLFPLTLFSNAAIGLLGYVNLAWKIGVIEGKLTIIMCAWLMLRGLLSDFMQYTSEVFISRLANGWLWTQSVLKPLHRVLSTFLILSAGVLAVGAFGYSADSPQSHQLIAWYLRPLVQNRSVDISPNNIVQFLVMFAVVYWAAKWSREFSYRWLFNQVKDSAVRNSLSVFTQYTTVIIGFFVMLKLLGIDLTTITLLAATLSVGIAFGIRDIFSNILSGFILLIERPVRKGDYVQVGGFEGEVVNIGVRAITVRTSDNKDVILPNNEAIVKSFTNWTHQDTVIRDQFDLKVAFQDDPLDIQGCIVHELNQHDLVLSQPSPKVLLKTLDESALCFEVRFYFDMRKIRSRADAHSDVMLAVLSRMKAEGIEIPYPKHNIALEGRTVSQDNYKKQTQQYPINEIMT